MNNTFYQSLIAAQSAGSALTNSTVATSLLPSHAKVTLPQNFFWYTGQKLRVIASGSISTVITTPGTFAFDLKFGSTIVFAGANMTLNVNAQTNTHWYLEIDLTARAVGSSANLMGVGRWSSHAVIGSSAPSAGGAGTHMLPYNTAPAVGTNFDSTATQQIDLFGTWSVANASNSITLHQFEVLSPN